MNAFRDNPRFSAEITRSYRATIPYADQQRLAQEIVDTARALEESPFVDPSASSAAFLRVPLAPGSHKSEETAPSFMSFTYSVQDGALRTANIDLADRQRDEQTFDYIPRADMWAIAAPARETPLRYVGHTALINALTPRLNKKVFEQLMDRADIDGGEIAQLLAEYMKKRARKKELADIYTTTDTTLGPGIESSLMIRKKQSITRHDLSVATVYETPIGNVRQEHVYSVTMGRRALRNAGGKLVLTATDEVPGVVLDNLAKHRDDADSVRAFARGIDELRALTDLSVLLRSNP